MPLALLSVVLAAAAAAPLPMRPLALPEGAKLVRLPPMTPMAIGLDLELPDRAALAALVLAQQTPGSPQYRHYLSPQQLGERFGLPAAEYESMARALEQRGFAVTRWPTRMRLDAVASVGQVERLLGVREYQVTTADRRWRTFRGTPTLPAELGAHVLWVGGLDSGFRPRHAVLASDPGGTQKTTFGPADLRDFYNVTPLHAAGYAGQNQSLAMLGSIPDPSVQFNQGDITTFFSSYSRSTAHLYVDRMSNPSQLFDNQSGLDVEETMDAELLTIGAPNAISVTMVLSPYDQLLSGAINYIVNSHPDFTVISISFGGCEAYASQSMSVTATDNYLAAGAAEGQSWFAASGDDGADDCRNGSSAAVDFPAAAPHMVGVGGTMYTGVFDSNNAVTAWNGEVTWNESGIGAGGGGVSSLFSRPTWQHGAGTSSVTGREVPDVSALADTSPGVAIYVYGTLYAAGNGTSDASPLTAGIFAAIASKLDCHVGLPTPQLYAFSDAQADGGAAVFHDLTQGDNSFNNVTGPSAHAGYDEVTGVGSLDANALANAYPASDCVVASTTGSTSTSGSTGSSGTTGGTTGTGIACDPTALPSTCGVNSACYPNGNGGGNCAVGCNVSGCSANQVCDACRNRCLNTGGTSKIGDACTTDQDCPDGAQCLTQATYAFPGGYCAWKCQSGSATCACPSGSQCVPSNFCLETCSLSAHTGCRTGYTCWDTGNGDNGVCMRPCTQNTECTFGSNDTCQSGACVPAPTTTSSTTTGGASSTSTSSTGTTGLVDPNNHFTANSSNGCGCFGGEGGLESAALLAALLGLARRRRG